MPVPCPRRERMIAGSLNSFIQPIEESHFLLLGLYSYRDKVYYLLLTLGPYLLPFTAGDHFHDLARGEITTVWRHLAIKTVKNRN